MLHVLWYTYIHMYISVSVTSYYLDSASPSPFVNIITTTPHLKAQEITDVLQLEDNKCTATASMGTFALFDKL